MEINSYTKEQMKSLIADGKNIAVIPSKISGTDAYTAAVGLYYMLKDMDKQVTFVYTGKHPEEAGNLINPEEVLADISNRELVIEVDYSGTSADKFHYKTDNNILQFRLGPIPADFDRSKVISKIKSFDFDLVFILGVQHLRDLGGVYDQLKDELDVAKIVNIDNTKRNTRFGIMNIIEPEMDTLSHIVFVKAATWGLIPGAKAAKALLTGMTYRTEKLSE